MQMDETASQQTSDGQALVAKRAASEEANGNADAKRIKTSHTKSPEPEPEPEPQHEPDVKTETETQTSTAIRRVPFPDKVCVPALPRLWFTRATAATGRPN
jgi:hypothetical protein